jgi:hypothetical protein
MTPIDRLPEFLQKELQSCPKAGEGVHGWLFKMGRQLHAHMPGVEIVNLLESCVANCGRHVPRSEIVDAVRNSLPCAWQPRGNQAQGVPTTTPKWPDLNREYRETITHEKDGVVHLWENSPIRFEDNESHTEEIIDALFFADSLLCCGN